MVVNNLPENNPPSVSKNGLQTLREALRLIKRSPASTCCPDPILVSIDFENTRNIKSGFVTGEDCQVGFATLDSRDLFIDPISPPYVIKTYNFVTGSPSYFEKVSRRFLFGDSSHIKAADLLMSIQSIIPQDRHVILIGHDVIHELQTLRTLGFNFSVSTFAIVDTRRVAHEFFGCWRGSLNDLLRRVHCPFRYLHTGGNDAHFTLRASLIMANKEFENIDTVAWVYLQRILKSPIPLLADPRVKRPTKTEKKREKIRAHQAKYNTLEKQNQLRAERAARKAEYEQMRLL